MAPRKWQPRRILGLAAVLFWLLLVQNAFGFPFRQTSSSLNLCMLYHNLDSLVAVVLTRSSHIVDDVETLYELRQLTLGGLAGREVVSPCSSEPSTLIVGAKGCLQLPSCSCAERNRVPMPSVRPRQYLLFVSPALLIAVPLHVCKKNSNGRNNHEDGTFPVIQLISYISHHV
jgi:hypothetical protein